MRQRVKWEKIPAGGKYCLIEGLERLVQLYEATKQTDKAAAWRKQLQTNGASTKKAEDPREK